MSSDDNECQLEQEIVDAAIAWHSLSRQDRGTLADGWRCHGAPKKRLENAVKALTDYRSHRLFHEQHLGYGESFRHACHICRPDDVY